MNIETIREPDTPAEPRDIDLDQTLWHLIQVYGRAVVLARVEAVTEDYPEE